MENCYQRSYRIPGRSRSSDVRALSFGKLGTSKCREKYDKPLTLTCSKMVEQKNVCSFTPVRTPKLQLAAEQPSTGQCWIPSKRYHMSKSKGEAPVRQLEGRNHVQNQTPYPPEMLRGLKKKKKTLCAQGPMQHVAKPSWRRSPLAPPQSCQADDP